MSKFVHIPGQPGKPDQYVNVPKNGGFVHIPGSGYVNIPDRIPESKNQNALIKQNFLVAFGSDEESYSDEGEDISGDPFWKPLLEVAAKIN